MNIICSSCCPCWMLYVYRSTTKYFVRACVCVCVSMRRNSNKDVFFTGHKRAVLLTAQQKHFESNQNPNIYIYLWRQLSWTPENYDIDYEIVKWRDFLGSSPCLWSKGSKDGNEQSLYQSIKHIYLFLLNSVMLMSFVQNVLYTRPSIRQLILAVESPCVFF